MAILAVFIILKIAGSVHTNPDAEGDRHFVADIDRFHIVQDMEALLLQLLQRAVFHQEKVFVFFQLFDEAVKFGKIPADLPVDQRDQKRPAHILHTLQRFVIIIQIGKTEHHFSSSHLWMYSLSSVSS